MPACRVAGHGSRLAQGTFAHPGLPSTALVGPIRHYGPSMSDVTIELDEAVRTVRCAGCGRDHDRVRGYLYRDGDAWVPYWADLYPAGDHGAHPATLLTVAIAEDWSDDSNPTGRLWAQLEVWPRGGEVRLSFADPQGMLDATYFGQPLSRAQALASQVKQTLLDAATHIAYLDSRVSNLLGTSQGN